MPSLDLDRVKQLTEYTLLEQQASILYQQCWNALDGPNWLASLCLYPFAQRRHRYC